MSPFLRFVRSQARRAACLATVFGCLLLLVAGGCASVSATRSPPLAPATLARLAAAQERNTAKGYRFPWKEAEAEITRSPGRRLLIVGYGSLMSLSSASETIRGLNEANSYPVLAAGAKRVFNYQIPPDTLKELGGAPRPGETAALNVVATGRSTDLLNGRIVPIALADLPALRIREYGYHLRPVTCVRWNATNPREAEPFTAYVLCAEDRELRGRKILDDSIQPNPAYVEICYDGAKSVSAAFADWFLESSFLADGRTTLRQWRQARGWTPPPPASR